MSEDRRYEFRYLDAMAEPESDWEPCDITEIFDEVDDMEELQACRALEIGQSYVGGGGAAQGFEIRRTA